MYYFKLKNNSVKVIKNDTIIFTPKVDTFSSIISFYTVCYKLKSLFRLA